MREDDLLRTIEMPWPVSDGSTYLPDEHEEDITSLRQSTRPGRPCGRETFVKALATSTALRLQPRKRGPKPKQPPEPSNPRRNGN